MGKAKRVDYKWSSTFMANFTPCLNTDIRSKIRKLEKINDLKAGNRYVIF